MVRRRAGARPATALALAGIALAALTLSFLANADPASAAATLVIRTPGTYDGHGATIDVDCGADNNVLIQASNVTLRNYTLLHAEEAAVRIDGKDADYRNIVIENVTIKDFNCADGGNDQLRAGVACWGCTALTVRNSHIETGHTYGDGIWVKNYGPSKGGGHTFTGNRIIGGWDGIGGEPEDKPYGGVYKNTLIQGNSVSGCHDDGIQVEGGNVNVRVKGNTVTDCGIGVAFAPNITGPLYIEGNVLRNLRVGDYGQQAAFKIGDAENSNAKGIAYITGNTISTAGDGFMQSNPGLSPIVFTDSCLNVSRYVYEFTAPLPAGSSFDRNVLKTTDTTRFAKINNDNDYKTLASIQAIGMDVNSRLGTCSSPPPAPPPAPKPPASAGGSDGSGGGTSGSGEQVSNSTPKPPGASTTAGEPGSASRTLSPDSWALIESRLSGGESGESSAERALRRADWYGVQKDVWVPLGLVVSLLSLDVVRRWRRARRAAPGATT
ncbi:MAG: right-handed parallel beta-helix repeat-containing protein [Dehalococcoidia bacterium]|nr:right-handed parallel beta-helix repeat-containing protein [Dehalococcoidia bacterium]